MVGNQKTPRKSAFEIALFLDGLDEPVLLYSKLRMKVFPDVQLLLEGLIRYRDNGRPTEMRKMKESCIIC